MLSILIPTYNDECFGLVKSLKEQAESLNEQAESLEQSLLPTVLSSGGIEIIVADDCSTDENVKAANAKIDGLNGCRIVWLPQNLGRAGIRNHLVSIAKGDWLLFIDGDMQVENDFIKIYLARIENRKSRTENRISNPENRESNIENRELGTEKILYGGYKIVGDETILKGNLRYRYERENAHKHTVEKRNEKPYSDFHTSNFLVPKSVMQRIPFNDDMKMYGFEDVLFGRRLKEAGIPILHIDNPVLFGTFESNAEFLRKTDESVRTQYDFRHEIGEYSTLIKTHARLKSLHLSWMISLFTPFFMTIVKWNLQGENPDTFLFNVYKLMKYNKLSCIFTLILCVSSFTNVRAQHIKPLRFDEATMDITHGFIGSDKAFQGLNLPQAFDGEGVVLGVTDIGFDFTHPTFEESNIVAFWDLLSRDTLNSHTTLFTGRDYDAQELRNLQHSYDGFDQTHGTHVLGIAAGGSEKYRGIAPKSDIVLANNVLSNNYLMVDSLQLDKFEDDYKFLEFQYMFDHAARLGKPCVINMSAGARQSFGDDFQKYNQMISEITGPGRIIVASAGNNGGQLITIHKRKNQQSVGSRAYIGNSDICYIFLQKEGEVDCNFLYSNDRGITKLPLPDDMYESIDTISDYDGRPVRYYVFMHKNLEQAGYQWLYVTLTGSGEGHLYTQGTQFINSGTDDGFNDADNSYGLHFPACYDDVICVGGTNHRNDIVNWLGEPKHTDNGEVGQNYRHTSVGPRLDGYQKPDISAPASCVISSYNSFYEEAHPAANDVSWDKEHFEYNGRMYAWNSNSGTSQAAPVVTGVIALWLQAKPDLTPQDIKDIFRRTATHPDPTIEYPNAIYGYGEIDAYAGLLDILGISGIKDISHKQPVGVRFAINDGNLVLTFQETGEDVEVVVYSTSGQRLLSEILHNTNNRETVSLTNLPKGIYAIQLNSRNKAVCGSTLIRR